jgi:hypothetical protein
MSHQLEKLHYRGVETNISENDRTMKSMKSYSMYNVKDFLPNDHTNRFHQKHMQESWIRDKIMTEPSEKVNRQLEAEINEMKRKLDLREEEKSMLEKDIGKIKK